MVDQGLIRIIREQFTLDWAGIHGAGHWARVLISVSQSLEVLSVLRD